MKKLILFSLISFCIATVSAQVINVPDKAQKQLQEKYVGATDVKWTNSVVNYFASFKMNGVPCKAHYSISGEWDYTEWFIKKSEIPEKAKDSFSKSKYRDWSVKSVASVEYPKDPTLYRYEVKKGMSKNYVFFDAEGNLVKTNTTL
jgi:hypothetical protein